MVMQHNQWKFLDHMLLEYTPGNLEKDRRLRKECKCEPKVGNKHWNKIQHILTLGGYKYLQYLISEKPSDFIEYIA